MAPTNPEVFDNSQPAETYDLARDFRKSRAESAGLWRDLRCQVFNLSGGEHGVEQGLKLGQISFVRGPLRVEHGEDGDLAGLIRLARELDRLGGLGQDLVAVLQRLITAERVAAIGGRVEAEGRENMLAFSESDCGLLRDELRGRCRACRR